VRAGLRRFFEENAERGYLGHELVSPDSLTLKVRPVTGRTLPLGGHLRREMVLRNRPYLHEAPDGVDLYDQLVRPGEFVLVIQT